MVNLPNPNEQPARVVTRVRGPRSHHNWGSRFGRNKESQRAEPAGLLRLEELTMRSVQLIEKHGPKSEDNYQNAMDLLRLQYNLSSCDDIAELMMMGDTTPQRLGVRG